MATPAALRTSQAPSGNPRKKIASVPTFSDGTVPKLRHAPRRQGASKLAVPMTPAQPPDHWRNPPAGTPDLPPESEHVPAFDEWSKRRNSSSRTSQTQQSPANRAARTPAPAWDTAKAPMTPAPQFVQQHGAQPVAISAETVPAVAQAPAGVQAASVAVNPAVETPVLAAASVSVTAAPPNVAASVSAAAVAPTIPAASIQSSLPAAQHSAASPGPVSAEVGAQVAAKAVPAAPAPTTPPETPVPAPKQPLASPGTTAVALADAAAPLSGIADAGMETPVSGPAPGLALGGLTGAPCQVGTEHIPAITAGGH